MTNRLERKFKELKKQNKKAFVAFITAGYPNLKITGKLVLALRDTVDVIELGVPFSDPMADGPIIQESSQAALKKKIDLKKILILVRNLRRTTDIPICLMTYYNPVFCFGQERFVNMAVAYGVDGIIIPDLPPEEGKAFIECANKSGLDVILFIAPTTSRQRIKYIARKSRGFIYYISLTGVTGPRQAFPEGLIEQLKLIKGSTNKPVCVGFGISSRNQVRRISRIADGVIVGSAIVKKIKDNLGKPNLLKKVSSFVETLRK